jgi:hypothetical protein
MGMGAFKYDAASDTFTPFTLADQLPQGHDAKCGLAAQRRWQSGPQRLPLSVPELETKGVE